MSVCRLYLCNLSGFISAMINLFEFQIFVHITSDGGVGVVLESSCLFMCLLCPDYVWTMYLLNHLAFCNWIWFASALWWAEMSHRKTGLLSSRSRSWWDFRSLWENDCSVFLTNKPVATQPSMVVHCYEQECHAKTSDCYLQGEGHSVGIQSCLLFFQPDLVCLFKVTNNIFEGFGWRGFESLKECVYVIPSELFLKWTVKLLPVRSGNLWTSEIELNHILYHGALLPSWN